MVSPISAATSKASLHKSAKSLDKEGYVHPKFEIKGNRKYGLAIAKSLQGPYIRYEGNPVVDFHSMGNNQQCEAG